MRLSSFHPLLLLFLFTTSTAYDLVGAWQILRSSSTSQLGQGLTFQFARSGDDNGKITSKLFVYDCFLSQFLFDSQEDELSLSFQTSSLLTQNCTLASVNAVRALALKVSFFQVAFDRLQLLSLAREPLIELVRQKYDYLKLFSGTWIMSMSQAKANGPARINGSSIMLCASQTQFSYSITTINGSYPRIISSIINASPSCDTQFTEAIRKSAFLQVAENLTHITLFDAGAKYVMTLDQIASNNPNEMLAVNNPPPKQAEAPMPETSNNQNEILATNNPPKKQAESPKPQTSAATNTSNPPQKLQSAPASTATSPKTQTNLNKQDQISSTPSTSSAQNKPPSTQQPPAPAPASIPINNPQVVSQPVQTQSFQYQKPQPVYVPPSPTPVSTVPSMQTSFSWDFGYSSTFSGSFSSSPLFSFDPSTTKISTTPSNTPPTPAPQYTKSVQNTKNVQGMQSQAIGTAQSMSPISDNSAQMADNDSGQTNNNVDQGQTAAIKQEKNLNMINNVKVGELISRGLSGSANVASLSEFVQSSKWLLVWLNGINSLQQLGRVYLIFAQGRMVLYCPCNTYYTSYTVQDINLSPGKWTGTNNQCQRNNDRTVTDYIFYATNVRQKRQNIVFSFKGQAKLAEFKPYY